MSASTPDNLSPLTSIPESTESVDAGALELGVESAWTHDDNSVTGLEQSKSVQAEPPSSEPTNQTGSDLVARSPAVETLEVPQASNIPLLDNEENIPKNSPYESEGLGSEAMSISPPNNHFENPGSQDIRYPQIGLLESLRYQRQSRYTEENEPEDKTPSVSRWANYPEDDHEIGEVPKYLVDESRASTPRIPSELKGKSVEMFEMCRNNDELDLPPDKTAHQQEVDDLRERICKLKRFVRQSQKAPDATQITCVQEKPKRISRSIKLEEVPHSDLREKMPVDSRYQRASSVLPAESSVKRAMLGHSLRTQDHEDPYAVFESEIDEHSSTESDNDECKPDKKGLKKTHQVATKTKPRSPHSTEGTKDWRDSNNHFGAEFLVFEPKSDHDSDSDGTKRMKRAARREYCNKLNLLKYQQNFIKNEPPFIYSGEANTTTLKKWV
ncbi:hypothetical protein EV424DRAFT_1345734 [Suillus variegatus]|nr:hypothetical protein EV424DRAFT_1345734 [Suillus variegatus]